MSDAPTPQFAPTATGFSARPSATPWMSFGARPIIERPAVGTSCCASTAEAIVAQELSTLPGVDDLTVDAGAGVVSITFWPADVDEAALAAALEEIGYPPSMET